MYSARTLPLSLGLSLSLLTACGGSEGDEQEAAQEAVRTAATTVSALTASTDVGNAVADAQGQNDNLEATKGELDQAMRCAQTSWSGGALVIDYGEGCEINGRTYYGSASVALTLIGGLGLRITFDDLGSNGKVNNGEVWLSLRKRIIETKIDLTVDENGTTKALDLEGSVTRQPEGFILEGHGSLDDDGKVSVISFDEVRLQGCYADSGSMYVALDGLPEATIFFDENTPSTGEVTVEVNGHSFPAQLPPVAGCPNGN